MRHLFFLLLCLSVLLTGCAATKPQPTDERTLAQLVPVPVRPDSTCANATQLPQTAAIKTAPDKRNEKETAPAPRRGIFSFLKAHKNPQETAANATQVPRKCKDCTFYYAPATVITAGKKATVAAGPSATALVKPKGQTQVGDGDTATAPVAAASSTLTFFGKIKLWLANAGEMLLLGLLILLILAFVFRKRLGLIAGFPL